MKPTIRKGTRGVLTNPDNRVRAALFVGAEAMVLKRLHFPDAVEIEFLNDGPYWSRGQRGEIPLRYFAKLASSLVRRVTAKDIIPK